MIKHQSEKERCSMNKEIAELDLAKELGKNSLKKAFLDGYKAYQNNLILKDNPYLYDGYDSFEGRLHKKWNDGWLQASEDV